MRSDLDVVERTLELMRGHLLNGVPTLRATAYAAAVIAAEELMQGTVSADQHRCLVAAVDAVLAAGRADRLMPPPTS